MTQSADAAGEFVRQLAALAGRLAARGLVVAQLHCDWSGFGSWRLDVQQGDAGFSIETSPTPPLSAPNRWKRQADQVFDSREAAFTFVEEYLARWVRAGDLEAQ